MRLLVFGSDGGRLEPGRERIIDEPGSNFLHGDTFELVRPGRGVDARERTAAQLLRTLRGDVDEKKAAGDRRRRRPGLVARINRLVCLRHTDQSNTSGCFRVLQGASGCFRVLQGASGCFGVLVRGTRTSKHRAPRHPTNYPVTSICFGFASSRWGRRTVSTPSLYAAEIRAASIVDGIVKDRPKGPYARSNR